MDTRLHEYDQSLQLQAPARHFFYPSFRAPYPEPRRRVRSSKTPGASTGSATGFPPFKLLPCGGGAASYGKEINAVRSQRIPTGTAGTRD
ncbi:MAG: hypothetical protein ACM3U1_08860 [Chloroflexota bacterium]